MSAFQIPGTQEVTITATGLTDGTYTATTYNFTAKDANGNTITGASSTGNTASVPNAETNKEQWILADHLSEMDASHLLLLVTTAE